MKLPVTLTESIHTLYHVFEPYRPSHFKNPRESYEDVDNNIPDSWFSISLQNIEASSLAEFYYCANTTYGNETFFRWILPRVFDLTITTDESMYFPELLGSKLSGCDWASWSARERDTVRSLIMAVWQSFLGGSFNNRAIDNWLGLLETCKLPLEPYLDHWDAVFESYEFAQRRFLDLLELVVPSLPMGKLDCFFADQHYQINIFKSWFLDQRKLEILEASQFMGEILHDQTKSCGSYFGAYRNMVRMHRTA